MIGRKIELDKVRRLRFTANALVDVEDELGAGWLTIFSDPKYSGVKTARAFLWAGLRHEDKRLTLQKAGDLIEVWQKNGHTLDELYLEIFSALQDDKWLRRRGENPDEETGEEDPGGPAGE